MTHEERLAALRHLRQLHTISSEATYFADTDADGIFDWRETELGTSTTSADTDRDGLSDYLEASV